MRAGLRAAGPQRGAYTAPSRRSLCVHAARASEGTDSRRAVLAGLGLALVGATITPSTATAASEATAQGFLKSTGGRGAISESESALVLLRQAKEEEAWKALEAEELAIQREISQTQAGKLCATPFGIDVVGITEAIALVGALVGGISANKRKQEVDKLNEQLRKINMQLRQQARSGTVFAPGLTYAPQGDVSIASILEAPPAAEAAPAPPDVAPPPPKVQSQPINPSMSVTFSVDEEDMTADQLACKDALRTGKRLLKERNGAGAMVRFEKALMLSRAVGDKVQQRRAYRGLAASSRLQGQYQAAIKHLHDVLELSRQMDEYTGDADAFGTIADCYTDMGDYDNAATYYDRYISVMSSEGVLV